MGLRFISRFERPTTIIIIGKCERVWKRGEEEKKWQIFIIIEATFWLLVTTRCPELSGELWTQPLGFLLLFQPSLTGPLTSHHRIHSTQLDSSTLAYATKRSAGFLQKEPTPLVASSLASKQHSIGSCSNWFSFPLVGAHRTRKTSRGLRSSARFTKPNHHSN